MTVVKNDIKCPKCNHKERVKVYSEITSERVSDIIDRSLFLVTCKKCQEKITIDYPLRFIGDNYEINYTPGHDKVISECSSKSVSRTCDTYRDFKEKVLILEDNLDDVVLEFIKEFLLKNLEDSSDVEEIRYNGRDEQYLYFYCFGVNKNISCLSVFYEGIVKRSKVKKIKDFTIIDSTTYRKYFKLR